MALDYLTAARSWSDCFSSPVLVEGLLLIFSGDSTIIQQFQVLSELVALRSDFHPVTGPDATRLQVRPFQMLAHASMLLAAPSK